MTKKSTPLELMGMPGSPYTRKMLALMRYRHIPYRLERQQRGDFGATQTDHQKSSRFKERPKAKVPLLPTYYLPDAEGKVHAVTDSTPLIRRFEKEFEGRSALPPGPALRLINSLIEDYADEWLTKAMFHYRWSYQADIDKAGAILPLWGNICIPEDMYKSLSSVIRERQISRLSYVGSNALTKPVIEQSFKRFLGLLDAHLAQHPFVLGQRPGSCDFAIYGQLTCLALFDPTPAAIILETAPRIFAWVEVMEDLSGYQVSEEDWLDVDALPVTLTAILQEIGRIYAPYLFANAQAVSSGADKVRTTLDGKPWEQNPFSYQVKCLSWLREEYAALESADQKAIDAVLAGTGAESLFA